MAGVGTALGLALSAGAAVEKETLAYQGWPNAIRLANEHVELVATTDVGPRILHWGFADEENLFQEWEEQLGKTGGDEWRIYGGHRLWHAPEVRPRTYAPDNDPLDSEWDGETLTLTQPTEPSTRVQKELTITMDPVEAQVRVVHRLTNHNPWPIELAPWALSVMKGPGRAILPQEPESDQLQPVRPMALWGYTDMADPRWTWGRDYIQLECDPEAQSPQKIGVANTLGWAAYYREGVVFLKRYGLDPTAVYPDYGVNTELYTNGDMLEVETLGPLVELEPGASTEHTEVWLLHRARLGQSEDDLRETLDPIVKASESLVPEP